MTKFLAMKCRQTNVTLQRNLLEGWFILILAPTTILLPGILTDNWSPGSHLGVRRPGPHVTDGIKVSRKAPGFLKVSRCYPTGPRIVYHWTSSTYERNTFISYLSHCYFAVLLNLTPILTYTSRSYYSIALKNKKVTLKHTIFP